MAIRVDRSKWEALEMSWIGEDGDSSDVEWKQDSGLVDQLLNWIREMDCTITDNWETYQVWLRLIHLLQPSVSRKNGPLQIAFYESLAKYEAERRTLTKPGKFFQKLFPNASGSDIESLVRKYKLAYDLAQFRIHVGETREDFVNGTLEYELNDRDFLECRFMPATGPKLDSFFKPLNRSCMRGAFFTRAPHPVEVYASGDFQIVTAWDVATDKLAARCIVMVKRDGIPLDTPVHAPIYTQSDGASECIAAHLESMGAVNGHNGGYGDGEGDWHGARLLKLEHSPGYVVFPYVDVSPYNATNRGDYLELCGGPISRNTDGRQPIHEMRCCYGCEEEYDEDDMTEIDGDLYCRDCRNNQFAYCDRCENWHSSTTEVIYSRSYGAWNTRNYCDDCLENDALSSIEIQGCTYIRQGLAYYGATTADNESVPQRLVDCGDWVLCSLSLNLIPSDDAIELWDGTNAERDLAEQDGYVESAENEIRWVPACSYFGPFRPECESDYVEGTRFDALRIEHPVQYEMEFELHSLPTISPSAVIAADLESEFGAQWEGFFSDNPFPCSCQNCQAVNWLRTGYASPVDASPALSPVNA